MFKSKEFKEIPSTDGKYSASEDGLIRNNDTKEFLPLSVNTGGYFRVSIGGKPRLVHRLVAEAWIPNPDKLPIVNHLDSNRRNNHYTNLEWTTPGGNFYHAYHAGRLRGEALSYVHRGDIAKEFDGDHRRMQAKIEQGEKKQFYQKKRDANPDFDDDGNYIVKKD